MWSEYIDVSAILRIHFLSNRNSLTLNHKLMEKNCVGVIKEEVRKIRSLKSIKSS